jgi:hypothetical protein
LTYQLRTASQSRPAFSTESAAIAIGLDEHFPDATIAARGRAVAALGAFVSKGVSAGRLQASLRTACVKLCVPACALAWLVVAPGLSYAAHVGEAGDGSHRHDGEETSQDVSPVSTGPTQERPFLHQRFLRAVTASLVNFYPPDSRRKDLGFSDFFTYGWTAGWTEPHEGPDHAPRFRLLRIQRAFWERELRLTYNFALRSGGQSADEQEGEFELELPISRRLLIEFEGGAVGSRPAGHSWRWRAGDLKIIPEVMLAESRALSFSSGLVVRTPTGGQAVGQGRASLTPYLALWKDLGHRVALHTFIGGEFALDGFERPVPDAIFQYAIAPTVTVTSRDKPYLGDLTFFIETNGRTNFGDGRDQTAVTLLPGARWMVLKDVWLAVGYEIPVTDAREFDGRFWLSLYLDF